MTIQGQASMRRRGPQSSSFTSTHSEHSLDNAQIHHERAHGRSAAEEMKNFVVAEGIVKVVERLGRIHDTPHKVLENGTKAPAKLLHRHRLEHLTHTHDEECAHSDVDRGLEPSAIPRTQQLEGV